MNIIFHPDPVLREVSKTVDLVDAEFIRKVDEMRDLMRAADGVGLAAIQVGWPVRMFVTERHVYINPVIVSPSQRTDVREEGCLSIPGQVGKVRRPVRVHLSAWTLEAKEVSGEIDGVFARVAQHEVDHMDGILFIDKLVIP